MELDNTVARKVQALLNMTTENGCTEGEAVMAAQRARALMDKYRLTMSDIQMAEEGVVKENFDRPEIYASAHVDYSLSGIGAYCGVKYWFTRRDERDLLTGEVIERRLLTILGLKSDVEMAYWLYEMICNTIENEADDYLETRMFSLGSAVKKKDVLKAFEIGMAHRIGERLQKMADDLANVAKTATGTSLVVVKNALIDEAFAKLNLKLNRRGGKAKIKDTAAAFAGMAAGNNVNLSRPLEGDASAAGGLLN